MNRQQRRHNQRHHDEKPKTIPIVRRRRDGRIRFQPGARAEGLGAQLMRNFYGRQAERFVVARRAVEDAAAELLPRPDL